MDFDQLRELCLSFPGATEGIKWEENLCFMVAEKIFCIMPVSGGSERVAFKIPEAQFEELTEQDGIVQAAHFAKKQWVTVTKYNLLKAREWQHYLRQSYDLVVSKLPKKIRAQYQ